MLKTEAYNPGDTFSIPEPEIYVVPMWKRVHSAVRAYKHYRFYARFWSLEGRFHRTLWKLARWFDGFEEARINKRFKDLSRWKEDA